MAYSHSHDYIVSFPLLSHIHENGEIQAGFYICESGCFHIILLIAFVFFCFFRFSYYIKFRIFFCVQKYKFYLKSPNILTKKSILTWRMLLVCISYAYIRIIEVCYFFG